MSQFTKTAFKYLSVLCLAGCALEGDPPADVMTWEEFRQASVHVHDGKEIFLVEWDHAVTEEELRERYDAYVQAHDDDGFGQVEQRAIVHDIGWQDDIWQNEQQLSLTYCVSTAFGIDHYGRAVATMKAATRAWERVARVNFEHLVAHDASCSNANPNVLFAVEPWTGGGACAFLPSGITSCAPRTLLMNFAAFQGKAVSSLGGFKHELGHILGLRHEHIHPASGANIGPFGGNCADAGPWRPVTEYDRASVMHYPQCNGFLNRDLEITSLDALGVSRLYGGTIGNLAAHKIATQSSTAFGGDPDRAVDRNVDGNWGRNSVTHTDFQAQPWWQVDLGEVLAIGHVTIRNRTDCCSQRLANFDIEVSNDGFTWLSAAFVAGPVGERSTHTIHRNGRYVRIKLRGTDYLSLAEVQVFQASRVLYSRMAFGGGAGSQSYFYTTPHQCTPNLVRVGNPELVWSSNGGGNCMFAGWVNPGDVRDCRANIVATTGGGWYGGVCRVWVRQQAAP